MEHETRPSPGELETITMSQKEFCELSGFSRSTVSRWVKAGVLPLLHICGRKYIRRDLIPAWLTAHTTAGRTPDAD
jgi:excisionase family DNA binding protein